MKPGKTAISLLFLGASLFLTGCSADASSGTRNRTAEKGSTADRTGAMSGVGETSDAMKSSGESDLDRRNRPDSETGMNSGSRSTTDGGTSLNGTERGNNPHRANR